MRTGSEPAEDGCGDGAAEQGEVSINCALSSETWNVVAYRYSTAHQVVIDADTRRVVVVGRPLPGNRHDSRGWEESGAKAAVGNTMTIADGGYQGTGLVIPHRRRKGEELPSWKEEHNRSHKQVRARVEHTFARMKTWKILRDCRHKGEGVHHAILGVARLHNLTLAG